jgi:photosystem II stability/assembly factor-like uncharacterized protein
MMNLRSWIVAIVLSLGLGSGFAAAPSTLGYQGRLTQNGLAVNGNVSVVFSLYAAASAGTALWTETQNVTVTNGLYSVVLGKTTPPIPANLFTQALWMGVKIGSDAEMTPRQELTSTPYSEQAKVADTATTASSLTGSISGSQITGQISQATIAGTQVTGTLSNVTVPGTAPWVATSGATQQAAGNTAYLATGATPTTITLPTSPTVGDVFKVSSPGIGGFTVVPNVGQTIATAGVSHDQVRNWRSVASSLDGSKLVAVVLGGQIYTSLDSGGTWIPRESGRNWYSVASSADGSKLVAVVAISGQIWTSTDSGATWNPRDSARNWFAVASSADGSKLVAVVNGGQIWTSTDSGATWNPRDSARNWIAVASSADGSKLVAVVNGGQIWTSTDSGVTWTARDNARPWYSVASSADGSKLVAVGNSGPIYTSVDSGANWMARDYARPWNSVASSADGNKLVAGGNGGQIYTWNSTFSGAQYASVELVYNGSGLWTLANQQGVSSANIPGNASIAGNVNIAPPGVIDFGWDTRQMLNLWGGGVYGIGIQSSTQYYRVDAAINTGGYAWYRGGTHSNTTFDPGAGGTTLMTLDQAGKLTTSGVYTNSVSTSIPNVTLTQTAGSDFARVRLQQTGVAAFWDVAAGGTPNDFNIYQQGYGNLISLHSPGNPDLMTMLNGARLTAGGAWTNASDRTLKSGFTPVDTGAILAKVAALPLAEWSYKKEGNSVRHLGPMAQDFAAAFRLGSDDKSIATVDESGVALAAIQGLNAKLEAALREKDVQLQAQAEKIAVLEKDRLRQTAQIAELQRSVEQMVARTQQGGKLALMH